MMRPGPRPRIAAGALVLLALWGVPGRAGAQGLGDLVNQAHRRAAGADSLLAPPPAPWAVVAGQVAVGTALSAAAGFGVGLLVETVCEGCDASEPGGGTAGLAFGAPLGAIAGVWAIGRLAPPPGRLADTVLGAFAGAAVFAGYAQILEGQGGNGVRWAGVVLPAALAAMGWHRSRPMVMPPVADAGQTGRPPTGARVEFEVLRVRF